MPSQQYGFWRSDKPKEPGFSHEYISCDFQHIKHETDMDTLEYLQRPDLDTLLKAFKDRCKRKPDLRFFGTRNGDHYEWMFFKEV